MPVSTLYPGTHLARHVRACRVGDQMIFLDLVRGKYFAMGGRQIPALEDMISGTTMADHRQATASDAAVLQKYIRRLRQQQLLADESAAEAQTKSPVLNAPATTWCDDAPDRQDPIEWSQVVRLWRSTFIAGTWLRRRSLADIAERLVALRGRTSDRDHRTEARALRASVESYMRLRPFALSAKERCLYDSLTLIHFLASQGLFAQWVIGVQVDPFGAHSWAQIGDVVLNDHPEHVRRFHPILVV